LWRSRKKHWKSENYDDDAFEIRVKLMPSMTESGDFIAEVNQLKAIMKSIIYPHPIPYIYTPSCFDVNHFLDFISFYSFLFNQLMHIHFKCVVKMHINLAYKHVANNFPTYNSIVLA
jgi:hypothetical protein